MDREKKKHNMDMCTILPVNILNKVARPNIMEMHLDRFFLLLIRLNLLISMVLRKGNSLILLLKVYTHVEIQKLIQNSLGHLVLF